MKILRNIIIILVILILCIGGAMWWFLGPVSSDTSEQLFIVPVGMGYLDTVNELEKNTLVRNGNAFVFLFNILAPDKEIAPGGYKLTRSMNAWEVMKKLTNKQDFFWVTINGCLRREQIGEMIGKKLGWDNAQHTLWNNAYVPMGTEYIEGVYYPDQYLIPVDESGALVAKRFIDQFNSHFAPLSETAQSKNIKWTTVVKIASLIEREAGGEADMPIISGIIWNRLDQGMPLQIDATMQYTRGKVEDNWWAPVDLAEKRSDSPYNSYLHKGLPPTPICSPGEAAMRAALNPSETDCLFYLHDRGKNIHCAKTYEEHLQNIKLYLQS